jgi:hypothetical protein
MLPTPAQSGLDACNEATIPHCVLLELLRLDTRVPDDSFSLVRSIKRPIRCWEVVWDRWLVRIPEC